MKRRASSAALVEYASSDEEQENSAQDTVELDKTHVESKKAEKPQKKRRTLPPLSQTFVPPAPIDDPTKHQGRIRTTPHVEGQWCAHIYVCIPIRHSSSLRTFLLDVLKDAREAVPSLQSFVAEEETSSGNELHISLSRPIYLRSHQREDLKKAVAGLARTSRPFKISFAVFCELINDEKTRTFLAMEIGAGHHELRTLVDALKPTLRAIRQREFYDNPRFHASLAWALLDKPSTSIPIERSTIPGLPKTLIPQLNESHGKRLSSIQIGTMDVEQINIKIGKDVTAWRFVG
ncbi:hypothetical protein BDN72DRAFT_870338 [Pluteus cervinus]|uniref:Uncharacterized protein n=1 Tax=Pluteus cervinus TaxID=181527 RepID=A0ACD3AXG5_9AGAR|nr:hypothetical protein BDN72DRAFT_870338 [Pluteus cervinus]